jgi:hypothetical protein
MSWDLSLSATISKYFNQLLRTTGTSNNAKNNPPDLATADEKRSAQIMLKRENVDNRSKAPFLRQRTLAPAPAALPQEHQDEIREVQHQRTQGRAPVVTASFVS